MDISNTKDLNNKFIFWRHDEKPNMFMLVGLAGSGKSTVATKIYSEDRYGNIKRPIVHSTDDVRKDLFGSETEQKNKEEVYKELVKRVKDDLKNNNDVIFDATNLSKKKRHAFLNELKKIPCYKQCICVMTPYEACLEFNRSRSRQVPESKIKKMYLDWQPPALCEGFDTILPVYNYGSLEKRGKYTLENLFKELDPFVQHNEHHNFTVGKHCREAAKYVINTYPNDRNLKVAAILHDNGKIFTQSETNGKGEKDGQYHFYNHHNVGAYNSMFYTEYMQMNYEDRIEIANLIYYHMHPALSWEQSQKALKKDVRLCGEDFYQKVMKLRAADIHSRGNKEKTIEQNGGYKLER